MLTSNKSTLLAAMAMLAIMSLASSTPAPSQVLEYNMNGMAISTHESMNFPETSTNVITL
ncbi:hypothetical protein BGZ74_002661, partial [Mortierella antarctica]